MLRKKMNRHLPRRPVFKICVYSMSGDFRKQKTEERIQQIVNTFVKTLSDSRLQFLTITKVELTNDFSRAKIFWDTYDSSKKVEITEALKLVKGKIRTQLSVNLKMRQAPEINLLYDNQYEEEQKIDEILASEKKSGRFNS